MERIPRDSRKRYTKECLYRSFLELIAEKPVSDITVIEICEKAGVSRKTFYKYYSDQFALLSGMQDDLFADYRDRISAQDVDVFVIAPALIQFADENRVLLRAIFANRGEGNFIDRIQDDLFTTYKDAWEVANPNMPKDDVEALFYFVVSGLTGLVRHWLFDRPEMTAEQVSRQADTLMHLADPNK